ncbi:MAG: hypothetical protein ACP5D7_01805 [Limnospira sp.]
MSKEPKSVQSERPNSPPTPKDLYSRRWYLGLDVGSTGLAASLLLPATRKVYPIYWVSDGEENRQFRLPDRVNWHPQGTHEAVVLDRFKPHLCRAIPHHFGASQTPYPLLQISPDRTLFLGRFRQALQLLISTLNPRFAGVELSLESGETLSLPHSLTCGAIGLEPDAFKNALDRLAGVIVGGPANASHAYHFNVREAILEAGLVENPGQILTVEDAIATRLAPSDDPPPEGLTLMINSGAKTTELMLVDFAENIAIGESVAYGGDDLNLDIICQLIPQDLIAGDNPNFRSPLFNLIENNKNILRQGKNLTLPLKGTEIKLTQADFNRRVLQPFIRTLNQELNQLMSRVGTSPVAVKRAICWGGNGSWSALTQWLRQKLPSAAVMQTPHPGESVASGLARVKLYPQFFDFARQQYGDYFLLGELLRVFGDLPLSVKVVMNRLEERGVNTRTCEAQILAILDGQLPAGFVPTESDLALFAPESRSHPDISIINQGALFYKDVDGSYFINLERAERSRQYLHQLSQGHRQNLDEPLAIGEFDGGVGSRESGVGK